MKIDTRCVKKTNSSKIKVEERGRKAVFNNDQRHDFRVTQIDGCVSVNVLAADFVVSKSSVGDVIVELKGGGVEHAFKQVMATASLWQMTSSKESRMGALVVAVKCPPNNTTIKQTAQERFAKRFGAPLHVVTQNFEYEIEDVLSFRGPF